MEEKKDVVDLAQLKKEMLGTAIIKVFIYVFIN